MKAGYCSECGANVYLDGSGACINGHSRASISSEYEAPDPAPASTPVVQPNPVSTAPKVPVYKQKWFLPVAMLVLGLFLGVGMSGSSQLQAQNSKLAGEVSKLKAQVSALTEERDSLKAELDPVKQQQEAAAAEAAAAAAAEAKAQADAQAAADAAAEAQAAEVAANTFTDGVYLVGEDIKPGTYRGTVTGGYGYWARLKNTSGGLDGIIANGTPSGPFVLTIKKSDKAVELNGVTLVRK